MDHAEPDRPAAEAASPRHGYAMTGVRALLTEDAQSSRNVALKADDRWATFVRADTLGTAQGSVDSLPVRLRPRWEDPQHAQAIPEGVPGRRDRRRPQGLPVDRAGRPQLRRL